MAARLRKGSQLGKYRLDRRLGRGAFSEVWKARDRVEGRDVALKVASRQALSDFGRAQIEREARIASHLSHPNVLQIRNADWAGPNFIVASDLARSTLESYRGAWRSGRIALRVIRDVAAGLAYAHSRRIMHRDVKPENILILPDGRAALCDFDSSALVAKKSRHYSEAGTLGYMAPEQAYGRPTRASDVFSLGLIAYEILTGVLPTWPFEWPPAGHDRFKRKVPAPVQPVLRKAAQFSPRRRYPDAGAFLHALDTALRRADSSEQRPSPRRRRAKRTRAQSPLEVQAGLFRRRHGAHLEMRFTCHRCEGPIAESMSFCPWCGSDGNSFRDLTPYPLVCPDCERGVRAEWTACPWCYAGRFEGNGRKPAADPRAERKCTRSGCEGQVRRFMRYCPLCKQKVRRAWTDAELPDRCPKCRWAVSREFWRHCPWCGRREPQAGTFVKTRA